MANFFSKLFDTSDFPQRWNCGNWESFHGWLHIVSDFAVFAAYTAIPLVILFFAWRRKRNNQPIVFPSLFWLFCAFIFACGTVHLIEAAIFFKPYYRISGVFKFLTAIFSWATVVALIRVSPKALALPTLSALNRQVEQEAMSLRSTQSQLSDALEELRNSHSLFDAVLRNVGAGVAAVNNKGEPLLVNPAADRISEMTMETFASWLDNYEVFLEDGKTPCEDENLPLARAISGETVSQELLNRNKHTGKETWVKIKATPVLDSNRQSMGAVVVFDDITELRERRSRLEEAQIETQTQLSETHERLSQVLNSITDVIWAGEMTDKGPEFKYMSPAIEQLTGRKVEDLLGDYNAYFSCINEEDRENAIKTIQSFASSNKHSIRAEYRIDHTNGSTRWIRSRVIRETKDGAVSFHGVISDIDHEKKTSQALFQAERLASLGTLSAGVAHEINNPLGAMMLTTESALRQLQMPNADHAAVSKSLNKVMDQIDRCSKIVDGVLMFAKNESSEKAPHSMTQVAKRARDMILFKARPKKISISLSDNSSDPTAFINPTEIEQVVVNLLSNAIDASPASSEVQLTIRNRYDSVEISVHDDGFGMDESVKQVAFDPFFTSKRESGGTGLGLSMCHTIVSNHGGTIDIRNSNIKQGAEVRFQIPVDPIETD